MKSKRTMKILAIMLAVAVLLAALCILPFLLLKPKGEDPAGGDPAGEEITSFEFEAEDLPDEKPLYPISHGGRNYYVAADGKDIDHADGTIENPYNIDAIRWFTRDKKEGDELRFRAGDQILLKRGDVFEDNLEIRYCHGEPDNPITIASYGDAEARPVIVIEQDVHHLSDSIGIVSGVMLVRCSDIVVRDLEVKLVWHSRKTTQVGGSGIVAEYDHANGNRYQNLYIVNNVVHSECYEEPDRPFFANTSGIKVNGFEDSYDDTPDDSYVMTGVWCTNNLVYNIGRTGIAAGGWILNDRMMQMKFTTFYDVHLDNNICYNMGCCGVSAGASTHCTMNRNLIHHAGVYVCGDYNGDDPPQEGEGGMMAICLRDGEIAYNEVYDIYRQGTPYDAMGIDIDWNCTNVTVRCNHTYNCEGSGIATMANANGKILNNRVEDNLAYTNQYGQIAVCDYVPWGPQNVLSREYIRKNSPDLLSLRYLEVAENLIKAAPENGKNVLGEDIVKSMFLAKKANGEEEWLGNTFHDNRVVYTGNGTNFCYNRIIDEVTDTANHARWSSFSDNRYFAPDPTVFPCVDTTPDEFVDRTGGALPYISAGTKFSSWVKRDTGATFGRYDPEASPSRPGGASADFRDGTLHIAWNASQGDVWHYNIYLLGENEEPDFRRLLAQTQNTAFDFSPESKGTFYIEIRPESNTGLYGEPLRLTVTLK